MHFIDFAIFVIYMTAVFGVGVYYYKKNKDREDYYVGGRTMSPYHVGLSVVATDVGGGFSIALGGLGFTMGLSGSWMLFTGLIGAWLAAIFIIPKVKRIDKERGMLTYPDFLRSKLGDGPALIAAIISGIGYILFTGGQTLAGAKLAAGTLFSDLPINIDPMAFSIIVIAGVILIYTVLGGLKAVIFTDTIQWIVLMIGLLLVAGPFVLGELGGLSGLRAELQASLDAVGATTTADQMLGLTNVSWSQLANWGVAILPIWLIAMTLYQRIFAVKDVKDARKAWFTAGLFEYPIMAFAGAFLGMAARAFFPEADPEMGLPRLLKEVLPIGLQGLVISAYFSAIMSTADSCLIASSGNIVNDILERYFMRKPDRKTLMRASQIATLLVGVTAILIALSFSTVLEIVLGAYSFMAAGMFVPTLAAYFDKRPNKVAAIASMAAGGLITIFLFVVGMQPEVEYPLQAIFGFYSPLFKLDGAAFGIVASALAYLAVRYSAGRGEPAARST